MDFAVQSLKLKVLKVKSEYNKQPLMDNPYSSSVTGHFSFLIFDF